MIGLITLLFLKIKKPTNLRPDNKELATNTSSQSIVIKKFESEEEVGKYILQSESDSLLGAAFGRNIQTFGLDGSEIGIGAPGIGSDLKQPVLERYSETNIQVPGIDEPDMVKTDGKQIYYVPNQNYIYSFKDTFHDPNETMVNIIKAFPPENLSKLTEIQGGGSMLLTGNTLVTFGSNMVKGLDTTEPDKPKEILKLNLKDNVSIETARLKDGKVFLVTRAFLDRSSPCPKPIIEANGREMVIDCVDIYYPTVKSNTDSLFTVLVIDPKNGDYLQNATFIGSSSNSVFYMSQNNIYITYQLATDFVEFFYSFITSKAQDLFDHATLTKLKDLTNLEISNQAKLVELESILSNYQLTLADEQRRKVETELTNRLDNYSTEHKRELSQTAIVKINTDNLESSLVGVVPGSLLNQFSLDEYNEHLRVATTISSNFIVSAESENDIYVLDQNQQIVGSVLSLGLGERIYSVRFVGNIGYAVTFRQTDPFYTIDLSNPTNPQKAGELKIPGFSSYLHPLSQNLILGVGSEQNQVKLSLFDVSKTDAPIEISKYVLDEFWTQVSDSHHAFLVDPVHKIFFLPGGKSAYIFSYQNSQINLVTVFGETDIVRAVYINDYLYILGSNNISVYNEIDWQKINSEEL